MRDVHWTVGWAWEDYMTLNSKAQYHTGSSRLMDVIFKHCKATALGTDLCLEVVWWIRCSDLSCSSAQRSPQRKCGTAPCGFLQRNSPSPHSHAPRCRNRSLLCKFHSHMCFSHSHMCTAASHHLRSLKHKEIHIVSVDRQLNTGTKLSVTCMCTYDCTVLPVNNTLRKTS